jgi:hypothetical protein
MENDLNGFLVKLEEEIVNDDLKKLFKYFYYSLEDSDIIYNETVNSALNLFYGNFNSEGKAESGEKWKLNLKNSIRERYQVIKTKKDGSEVITHKLKEPSKNTLESLQAEDYLEKAKEKWIEINKELVKYFIEIKKRLKVDKTLIYEAPPYLMSIDDQGEIRFEAEFIFDDNCTSPYANAIKKCFNSPLESRVQDLLIETSTGFFDVIPIPMPINSDLRQAWSTDEKFIIEGKRIFVHFFEWAIKIYLFKLNGSVKKHSHKLAFGIPLKNAVTLYEYSRSNKDWFCELTGFHEYNFLQPHDLSAFTPEEGLWLQMYKSCIIGSSNTPSGSLMKIAFDL